MTSARLAQLLNFMRDINGTPLGAVRDGVVALSGAAADLAFLVQTRSGTRSGITHPLVRIMASQIGDPLEHWDLRDLPAFRAHNEEMLDYLPRRVESTVTETTVGTPFGDLRLREFVPAGPAANSCVIFLHGGGFVLGTVASNDPECDYIARHLNCTVVSVEYPLAPENMYPTAVDALQCVMESGYFDNYKTLSVVGESAGASLALLTLQRSERVLARVDALALAYPLVDLTLSGESVARLGRGYFLTKELLELFVSSYLPEHTNRADPRVSPLYGDLSKLPRMLVLVGEFDPLLSDARRLTERGADTRLIVYPGMIHGFLQFRGLTATRTRALRDIVHFLSQP